MQANVAFLSSANIEVNEIHWYSYYSLPSSYFSAFIWHYRHYNFVYVIDINTHVLLFFNYYIVLPFAQFWITGCSKKLVDYWCIWRSVFIFQVKNTTNQREVQYLGNINNTVCFFVFWCWNFVTRFYIQKFYRIYFHY